MSKRVFVLIAVSLWGLSACAHAQTPFASAQPIMRVDYWQQRQADINSELRISQDLSHVKLVFLGDSITDFWLLGDNPWNEGQRFGRAIWDETFVNGAAENRAFNLGISGDRTEHVLFRLQPASAGGMGHLDRSDLNPDFIILLVGINNSWDPEEPLAESVLAGIRAVLDAAHARKSSARIVLQTLLPTNDPARNAQVVAPVNVELAAIARDEDYARFVLFLDLHAAFVDEGGNQIAAYFNDGLHPNEAGYRAWRDRLIAFLDAER